MHADELTRSFLAYPQFLSHLLQERVSLERWTGSQYEQNAEGVNLRHGPKGELSGWGGWGWVLQEGPPEDSEKAFGRQSPGRADLTVAKP